MKLTKDIRYYIANREKFTHIEVEITFTWGEMSRAWIEDERRIVSLYKIDSTGSQYVDARLSDLTCDDGIELFNFLSNIDFTDELEFELQKRDERRAEEQLESLREA